MRPTVLVIDDDPMLRASLGQWLELAGVEARIVANAQDAFQAISLAEPDVVLSDVRMPRISGIEVLKRLRGDHPDIPVVLLTGHGDIPMAVEAMRLGAFDFMTKPYDPEHLVAVLKRAAEHHRLRRRVHELEQRLDSADRLEARLMGNAPEMARLRTALTELAALPVNVIINGETGTGKEVVAKALHDFSSRSGKSYVAINCAAIPSEMFESELFGHEAGAFTGAKGLRIGKLEHANGGTVLLDEIESMPLTAQSKVLRVIQERVVERLGSNRLIPIDVRFVVATKADLKKAAADGHFRSDLYFRLAGVELIIPPLRDRGDDVLLLFDWFASAMAARIGKPRRAMSADDTFCLLGYDWPGNVRELKTVAERFALDLQGTSSNLRDLVSGAILESTAVDASSRDGLGPTLPDRMAAFEKAVITAALRQSKNSVLEALHRLGIPRRTLNEKMAKYGIDRSALTDRDDKPA